MASSVEVDEDDGNIHDENYASNDDQALSTSYKNWRPERATSISDYTEDMSVSTSVDEGIPLAGLRRLSEDGDEPDRTEPFSLEHWVPTVDEFEERLSIVQRQNHESKKASVLDWLGKNDIELDAEADNQSKFVPDPLLSTSNSEIPLVAMQSANSGQGHDQPKPAQVPETANASIELFQNVSKDNYEVSLAATWGSASVDSNHELGAYLERRRKGIEGRKGFFTDTEDDESLQIVQELLSKWTTVDDPIISDDNGERLRLLFNYP